MLRDSLAVVLSLANRGRPAIFPTGALEIDPNLRLRFMKERASHRQWEAPLFHGLASPLEQGTVENLGLLIPTGFVPEIYF